MHAHCLTIDSLGIDGNSPSIDGNSPSIDGNSPSIDDQTQCTMKNHTIYLSHLFPDNRSTQPCTAGVFDEVQIMYI